MLQQTFELMTEEEEELIILLVRLGIRRTVARVLAHLMKTKQATSQELERYTDLRQPEVSLAVADLAERGWIRVGEVSSDRKGRPQKIYTLKVTAQKIHATLEREINDETDLILTRIKRLREFA